MPRYIKMKRAKKSIRLATEAELLAFCNKVREAGQADVLDALLPSVPGNENACLIANALNFRSTVLPVGMSYDYTTQANTVWVMRFPTSVSLAKRREIAKAVGCEIKTIDDEGDMLRNVMVLPEEIGHAANAFDDRIAFTRYIKKGER